MIRSALAILTGSVLMLALATGAQAHSRAHAAGDSQYVGSIAPTKGMGELDCNGWSSQYPSVRPAQRELCTDPVRVSPNGQASRLNDNGWYVGHDEPSVKFISSAHGSGNTMTYFMKLPVDPSAPPTADGSVTDYAELSPALWFGLPICDPHSFPQNPCKPDSDQNQGALQTPAVDAGSAFLELQFYAPGFTPWWDSPSCDRFKWCSALNIDSFECSANGTCNDNCIEPVNFAWLQRDGVPSGPPNPQEQGDSTYFPNDQTLMMNSGDVLEVAISDPPGGLLTVVRDLTTGQTGFMQASARNGFANTNIQDCSGNPFTFHAEYDTARQQNQVPWAALEGGVLMEQETGHFESCDSLANASPYTQVFGDGSTFYDPSTYQTCVGGLEGANATGEGPCSLTTGICTNSTTQGPDGAVACPTNNAASGELCEFSDGFCRPAGYTTVYRDGQPYTAYWPVNGCLANEFQNGDLDFDGNPYQTFSWPNGSPNTPTVTRYIGPFSHGRTYPQVQFETDIAGSEFLCNPTTGAGCTAPPIGANFYPFWTLSHQSVFEGSHGPHGPHGPHGSHGSRGSRGHQEGCTWNFGTDIPGVTVNDFGQDAEYGTPDIARYGGTIISPVESNPQLTSSCS